MIPFADDLNAEVSTRGHCWASREKYVQELTGLLADPRGGSAVLVGDPGVGKTALVEALAKRISDGSVPPELRNKCVFSLRTNDLIAGTEYRGQFEDRLKELIESLRANSHAILFIDELHTLLGLGRTADTQQDAVEIIKTHLSRGTFRLIGATTTEKWAEIQREDSAFSRRLRAITIAEPEGAELNAILHEFVAQRSASAGIVLGPGVVEEAIRLSTEFQSDLRFPAKGIELLNYTINAIKTDSPEVLPWQPLEECHTHLSAALKSLTDQLDRGAALTAIEKILSLKTLGVLDTEAVRLASESYYGVKGAGLARLTGERALNARSFLDTRVIGQTAAKLVLEETLQRIAAGFAGKTGPAASVMFLGPTGVGKTALAYAMAELIFNDRARLWRCDCGELKDSSSLSKLFGAAPGFAGFGKAGIVEQAVLANHGGGVLLFDEIEKASPELLDALLGILDYGRFTTPAGRALSFKKFIFLFTSNLPVDHSSDEAIRRSIARTMRPEFVNRIDTLVCFDSLSRSDLLEIAKLETEKRLQGWSKERNIQCRITEAALQRIVESCEDSTFGARPIGRSIEELILAPLAKIALSRTVETTGGDLVVDAVAGEIRITWS